MGILGYILGYLLTILIGFLVIRLILKGKLNSFYLGETAIYSFMIGTVAIPFLLFLSNLCGLPLSLPTIIIIPVLVILLLLFFNYFRNKEKIKFCKVNFFENIKGNKLITNGLLCVGIIRVVVKLTFGAISILNVPTYQDDTFANRNMRAKVFYEREDLVLDKNDDDFLGQGFNQYPLTPSLYKTFLMKMTGYWDEGLVNLPSFIFYLSIIVLLFYCVFRYTNKVSWSILSSIILAGVPLYYIHGTNPYMDVFQSLYYFAGLYILYQFINKKIGIGLPILFIGMLGYTKSEGLLIFTIAALGSYILYHIIKNGFKATKKELIDFIKIVGGVLAINLPFIVFKIIYGLGFLNGNQSMENVTFETHPEIFKAIYNVLFNGGCYNILFFAIIVGIILYLYNKKAKNEKGEILRHFTGFLIALCIIIFVYFTTYTYTEVLTQTGVNRSFMQLIPVVVYPTILLFYKIYEER